jgi:hypothetical protein
LDNSRLKVNFNDEERKDLQDTVKLWAMGRDKGNQERRHPVIMMQRERLQAGLCHILLLHLDLSVPLLTSIQAGSK